MAGYLDISVWCMFIVCSATGSTSARSGGYTACSGVLWVISCVRYTVISVDLGWRARIGKRMSRYVDNLNSLLLPHPNPLTSEYSDGVSVTEPGMAFIVSASEAQTCIDEEEPTLGGFRITLENTLSTLEAA